VAVADDTFFVVDGHAQFFRAYYAIRGGMTSPTTNEPTQMAFGFVGMLARLIRERRPAHLVLVIDAAGDQETFRSEIFPEYKAHRDPAPIDFHGQVERCLEFTRLMGIPIYAIERVEADDVIATIVRRVRRERPELRVRIVSRDKDLSQLVDEQTTLFDPQSGTDLGPEQLFETKGVRADQVADMLALMGDSVDNVPGVAGIGPKTAAQLITSYGSLDGVLANLSALTPRRRESIEAARATLAISRRLVALKEDCDIELDYAKTKSDLSRADRVRVIELMSTLGFGRLKGEIVALLGGEAVPESSTRTNAATAAGGAGDSSQPQVRRKAASSPAPPANDDLANAPLFAPPGTALEESRAAGISPEHPARKADYRLVRTGEELKLVVAEAQAAAAAGARIAFDTETDGLNTRVAKLCGISLAWTAGKAVYIPVRSPEPASHCSLSEVLAQVGPLLEDAAVGKVAHNAKFDIQVLERHGIRVRGLVGDSMIASYVNDSTRVSHSLDSLAQAYLDYAPIPLKNLIGTGDFQRTFDQVPLTDAAIYAAEDADIAHRLDARLTALVDAEGLGRLYRDLEVPLVEVLASMESNGIRVDAAELNRQCERLSHEADAFRDAIVASAPHAFNPDSPKQLAAVLFNEPTDSPPGLGLPLRQRSGAAPSTSVEVLERLAADPAVASEIPAKMIEYRQLRKLVGTYLVALREAIEPTTGRIHASFHQTGTATGRLSSSEPNMQNIPIRTALGREVRRAFVPPPDFMLLSCDYSQIELRVLAHLANDPAMIEAFQAGLDIHATVAGQVHGIPVERVTSEQRSGAKMVNFGIVYGITPYGLARRLGGSTTPQRAKQIIDAYRARYSKIDSFLQRCVDEAKERGFVTTMLGRRRAVPQVASRNPAERALGERIAINTVVQGSAADIMKLAMLDIHRAMPAAFPDMRLLLQIHDELVLEAPATCAEAALAWVRGRMEAATTLAVPLVAEGAIAANWYDAK
jgi:DNA polymerase-1